MEENLKVCPLCNKGLTETEIKEQVHTMCGWVAPAKFKKGDKVKRKDNNQLTGIITDVKISYIVDYNRMALKGFDHPVIEEEEDITYF